MKQTEEKALIQLRTTKTIKEKIQKKADTLNLSITQFLLKSVEDKDEFISVFEVFNRHFQEIKEKIDTSFYYLKEDTEELKEIKSGSNKHFITININKEDIEESDLILIKGNVLEVLEHNKDEQVFIALNLINDKKLQLKYENFTEDTIIKRKM